MGQEPITSKKLPLAATRWLAAIANCLASEADFCEGETRKGISDKMIRKQVQMKQKDIL